MEQKRFVKVGLSTENMRAYVGMIEDEVENFFRRDPAFAQLNNDKGEWGRFDSLKAFSEITILTATTTLQGKQIRDKMDKTFADLYNDLDGGFTPLNFLFPNLPLESYRKRDIAHKKMSEFYVNIIKERRASGLDSVSLRASWTLLNCIDLYPARPRHDVCSYDPTLPRWFRH